MQESARRARNAAKLAECYPAFRARLARTIAALERQGYRPRIQEAWRSPADQQRAYETGRSHLRYGLHNATGPGGRKEALAADVLDDDRPTAPGTRYLIALAVAAGDAGLGTGILWGLSGVYKTRTAAAVSNRDVAAQVRMGWDPTHVQVRGVTAAQARRGVRPPADRTPAPAPPAPPAPPAHPAPPQPTPAPEEDDVKVPLVIVKVNEDAKRTQYLVVPGQKPLAASSTKTVAAWRRMYPDIPPGYVEIDQVALDDMNRWADG